jgi:hypothetical protein
MAIEVPGNFAREVENEVPVISIPNRYQPPRFSAAASDHAVRIGTARTRLQNFGAVRIFLGHEDSASS